MSKRVKSVIKKFGSLTEMSNATGFHIATINNWRRSDIIPSKHQRAVLDAAKANGIELEADEVIS